MSARGYVAFSALTVSTADLIDELDLGDAEKGVLALAFLRSCEKALVDLLDGAVQVEARMGWPRSMRRH